MLHLPENIAALLLPWYDQNARKLPWRDNPDPYWIWISEIMLQQTRLQVVLPYFERFIKDLPDISALASADEARLLKLWEGLGYYSRARNLQKAAKQVVTEYNGTLPANYHALLKLPGIGDYTAGAIASAAFGIAVPAVDGNVLRVTARLAASEQDITLAQTKKEVRTALSALIPSTRPGDFNQSLMDLGATVCLPNTIPLCENCPLNNECKGKAQGVAAELPIRSAAKSRRIEQKTILLILSGNRVLLHKRKTSGLLAGLWEFPNLPTATTPSAAKTAVVSLLQTDPVFMAEAGEATHIFTHIEWHMRGYAFLVNLTNLATLPPDYTFVTLGELRADYTLPGAFKFYLNWLERKIES